MSDAGIISPPPAPVPPARGGGVGSWVRTHKSLAIAFGIVLVGGALLFYEHEKNKSASSTSNSTTTTPTLSTNPSDVYGSSGDSGDYSGGGGGSFSNEIQTLEQQIAAIQASITTSQQTTNPKTPTGKSPAKSSGSSGGANTLMIGGQTYDYIATPAAGSAAEADGKTIYLYNPDVPNTIVPANAKTLAAATKNPGTRQYIMA